MYVKSCVEHRTMGGMRGDQGGGDQDGGDQGGGYQGGVRGVRMMKKKKA